MTSYSRLHNNIAFIASLLAVLLVGGFLCLNDGFVPVGAPLDSPIPNRQLFIAYIVLGYLFLFGTPLLCAVAFFFGFSNRRFLLTKIGIVLSTVSILLYLSAIRGCFQLIQ
jgi:hypothetical protein